MAFLTGIFETLLAIAPGFVLMGVYRRQRHEPDPSDARFAAASLVASIFPHLAVLAWSVRVRSLADSKHLSALELAGWAFVLVVFVPTLLGLAATSIIEAPRLQPLLGRLGWGRAARTRTSWVWAFTPEQPSWLLATLRDGSVVGGLWDAASFASLDYDRRDLFVGKPFVINVDRTFGERLPGSNGMWINGADIMWVEFYAAEVEENV